MNTHEMIAILRISDDPQKLAVADELAALLDEEILWQERVGQLEAENARLTAELAAAREALGQRDYCNTCGKVQPVAPVYSDDGPYGTYCAICNNSIGSHGDPPF